MPTTPWTQTPATSPVEASAIMMATRLQLRSLRDAPGFLWTALALRRQVLDSPGALGVSIAAQPLSRTFWTLSAWRDQASLRRFVVSGPHRAAMDRYRQRLHHPVFVSWTVPPGDVTASWAEARARVAADQATAAARQDDGRSDALTGGAGTGGS